MGPKGMREIGEHMISKSHYALKRLREEGYNSPSFSGSFFGDLSLTTKIESRELSERLVDHSILGGLPLGRFYPELNNVSLFSFNETHSFEDIETLVSAISQIEGVRT
jgi:glycine dehydrogenase subunit 1